MKVKKYDITDCELLKEYKGDLRDPKSTIQYIENIFRESVSRKEMPLYCHYSNATDRDLVERIFSDVKDSVIQLNLMQAGLLHSMEY